jgi:hypothetical protein
MLSHRWGATQQGREEQVSVDTEALVLAAAAARH